MYNSERYYNNLKVFYVWYTSLYNLLYVLVVVKIVDLLRFSECQIQGSIFHIRLLKMIKILSLGRYKSGYNNNNQKCSIVANVFNSSIFNLKKPSQSIQLFTHSK